MVKSCMVNGSSRARSSTPVLPYHELEFQGRLCEAFSPFYQREVFEFVCVSRVACKCGYVHVPARVCLFVCADALFHSLSISRTDKGHHSICKLFESLILTTPDQVCELSIYFRVIVSPQLPKKVVYTCIHL